MKLVQRAVLVGQSDLIDRYDGLETGVQVRTDTANQGMHIRYEEHRYTNQQFVRVKKRGFSEVFISDQVDCTEYLRHDLEYLLAAIKLNHVTLYHVTNSLQWCKCSIAPATADNLDPTLPTLSTSSKVHTAVGQPQYHTF